MTARPEGASDGTRGLGLFLVPRLKPDGTLNTFRMRRLKDKLGTRSMASAEMDFADAYAEALGPVDSGFKSVIQLVITTSRLYNAQGARRMRGGPGWSRAPTRSTAVPLVDPLHGSRR